MKKITYHKEGDYLVPDLIMEDSYDNYQIGKYGRLRLNYIKKYKRGLYMELMMNGTLSKHLADIVNAANDILKEWLNSREESLLGYLTEKDKQHQLLSDV